MEGDTVCARRQGLVEQNSQYKNTRDVKAESREEGTEGTPPGVSAIAGIGAMSGPTAMGPKSRVIAGTGAGPGAGAIEPALTFCCQHHEPPPGLLASIAESGKLDETPSEGILLRFRIHGCVSSGDISSGALNMREAEALHKPSAQKKVEAGEVIRCAPPMRTLSTT
jgi:hypothetical protein